MGRSISEESVGTDRVRHVEGGECVLLGGVIPAGCWDTNIEGGRSGVPGLAEPVLGAPQLGA